MVAFAAVEYLVSSRVIAFVPASLTVVGHGSLRGYPPHFQTSVDVQRPSIVICVNDRCVNNEIGTRYLSCYGSLSFIFTPSDIFSTGCSFVIETINISEVSSGRCQSNSGIQRHDSSARASLGRSMIDAADGRGRRKVP